MFSDLDSATIDFKLDFICIFNDLPSFFFKCFHEYS